MTNLIWLRRDLRLHDHAALSTALAAEGPVQPVFIFDTDILARFTAKNDRRLVFLAECLCHIDAQLRKRGGGLLVLHGSAPSVMPKLAKALQSKLIVSAEDFEPETRARDASVKKAVEGHTRFVQVVDHLMRHPNEMLKDDGTPYKVFTPFYKKWRASISPGELGAYDINDKQRYATTATMQKTAAAAGLTVLDPHKGPEAMLAAMGYSYAADETWTVDDAAARLKDFMAQHVKAYPVGRNLMGKVGTSRLSPYLRFGLVSIRECMRAADAAGHSETWVSELCWREFYAAILFHFPHVVTQEFAAQYRGVLPWSHDKKHITALTTGTTGYPVVDAAVRELLNTGWMHNRARMIVASFATKHLLLDWRIGEEFFAQYLMDYELASNNGGWQWSASTGTDAQPYFRVFNPTLQSQKFDPHGAYIRHYVPELENLSDKEIHAPSAASRKKLHYPEPIVDHATARTRAIAVFKAVRSKS